MADKKKRKRTIFKMFLIPLIGIMLIQSLLSLGILMFQGTTKMLQNYSSGIMARMVENRKVILQNDMTQRWAAVAEKEENINLILEKFLKKKNITLEGLLASEKLQNEFLEEAFPECISSLETNLTTGMFLILTGQDIETTGEFSGFFLRDSNPLASPAQNSDLLMERGSKQLARTFDVPLDTYWTKKFSMHGNGKKEEEDFFYAPWSAGTAYPEADITNLGYWSEPFVLSTDKKDPHSMIAYSVPLRYEGSVYGVIGIEVSISYLYDYLPVSELNRNERGGYAIAILQDDETYKPLFGQGVLYNTVKEAADTFSLDSTNYENLSEVKNVKTGSQNIYAVTYPLKLYGSHVPYKNTNWVLIGFNEEEDLFGMGRQLYFWMIIALLAGLIFGLICIYLVVHRLTTPIKRLMSCIHKGREGLSTFQESNILEVDELYGVVNDLTERQKEVEEVLLEEKELYRIILETTKDAFFSYDFRKQVLDIVNSQGRDGRYDCAKLGMDLINPKYIKEEERDMVRHMLEKVGDKLDVQFRMKLPEMTEYRWVSLTGTSLYDAEGNRWKLVGRYWDIQEEKMKEEEELRKITNDGVTGFFQYSTGMTRLEEARKLCPEGVMIYIIIDNLQEITDENGITFCDMILEDFGQTVRENTRAEDLRVRFNLNSFCVWLPKGDQKAAVNFAEHIFEQKRTNYNPDTFKISMHMGIASAGWEDSTKAVVSMAHYAQIAASKQEGGSLYCCYDNLEAPEVLPNTLWQGDHIVTAEYGKDINLVSVALLLFGKGTHLDAQMYLLFRKIGLYYEANDIFLMMNQAEFHSCYIEYQWHKDPSKEEQERVIPYEEEEWQQFAKLIHQKGLLVWTKEESLDPIAMKFCHAKDTLSGYALPLYDNGSIIGILSLNHINMHIQEDEAQTKNLIKIASVIQSQMNQQRHDIASQAKTDFLSRMSHEIRTPMNGIIGMTAIARQENQSMEKIQECLKKIETSSDYLLVLINDILDMSKIESGKMQLHAANFSMTEQLDTVQQLIVHQAEEKGITFIQHIQLDHEWYIADQLRISQVLINLLGNAVKFTQEQGTIVLTVMEVDADETQAKIFFSVKDNGIGIQKENQERIFRSFEQSQDNMVSGQKGTGLGLSISSRLVKLMGSVIDLESMPGEGSDFSFTLSLPIGKPVESDQEKIDTFFDGFHVLVVEDNELNAEIAQSVLEDYHFEVDIVHDGAQAVQRMKETEPGTYDLILMDIMMPVMDGMDATREIRGMNRADCHTIPIIAMSANVFDDDLKKAVECGMNGYLPKPIEIDKLHNMLKEILKG
jgi:diguanylate cyclase (GGDEF)-like protein